MLSPEQEQFLRLFRTQGSVHDARSISGVSSSQHDEWCQEKEYVDVLLRLQREIFVEKWGKWFKGEE